MENYENFENENEQNIDDIQSNNFADQINQFINEQSVIETNSIKSSVNSEGTKTKTEFNSKKTIVLNLITENFYIKKKKIKTSDFKVYEIPCDYFMKSKLLSGLIDDYDGDDDEIPLNEVDSKNFELIIDYLVHYKDKEPKEIPKPFPERTDEEFLKAILDNNDNNWTYYFISKLSIEEAINLVNCSFYLQIEGLVNLLAAKLAHEMCNCEVEEARRKFGIECDLSEEEIAEYEKYPLP